MIRKYHEQNHAHKFYSSDKMDRFFLSHNLSTLTQEDTDNPNNTISGKKKNQISNESNTQTESTRPRWVHW